MGIRGVRPAASLKLPADAPAAPPTLGIRGVRPAASLKLQQVTGAKPLDGVGIRGVRPAASLKPPRGVGPPVPGG